jgi:hypothetical protein
MKRNRWSKQQTNILTHPQCRASHFTQGIKGTGKLRRVSNIFLSMILNYTNIGESNLSENKVRLSCREDDKMREGEDGMTERLEEMKKRSRGQNTEERQKSTVYVRRGGVLCNVCRGGDGTYVQMHTLNSVDFYNYLSNDKISKKSTLQF